MDHRILLCFAGRVASSVYPATLPSFFSQCLRKKKIIIMGSSSLYDNNISPILPRLTLGLCLNEPRLVNGLVRHPFSFQTHFYPALHTYFPFPISHSSPRTASKIWSPGPISLWHSPLPCCGQVRPLEFK